MSNVNRYAILTRLVNLVNTRYITIQTGGRELYVNTKL